MTVVIIVVVVPVSPQETAVFFIAVPVIHKAYVIGLFRHKRGTVIIYNRIGAEPIEIGIIIGKSEAILVSEVLGQFEGHAVLRVVGLTGPFLGIAVRVLIFEVGDFFPISCHNKTGLSFLTAYIKAPLLVAPGAVATWTLPETFSGDLVMILMTPPTASAPYTVEAPPLTISI